MKNAVIYVRVSTEEQAKHGYSIDAQVKNCEQFASQNGYSIVRIFKEEGLSAKDLKRPQLNELFKYCKKNKDKIDFLIFWKWDRLSRGENKDYAFLDNFFEECEIYPLSVTECNEDTPEGKLLRWITKGTNRYEIEKASQRTKLGMRGKAESGGLPGKAPIGYLNYTNPDGSKTIVVDPKNARFVKRAFELYASGNYSYKMIGDELAKDGFLDKMGKKYPPRKFEWMFKNVFFIGKFQWSNTIYEGSHEPIVPMELFYAVQAKLNNPKNSKARTHNVFFPFNNLIQCEKCGCYLSAQLKRGAHNSGEYIYYNCTGKRGGECRTKTLKSEVIEKALTQIIEDIYLPPSVIVGIKDKAFQMLKDIEEFEMENSDAIRNKIETLKTRRHKSYIDKLDDNLPAGMTENEWQVLNKSWNEEIDKLHLRLQEIDSNTRIVYGKVDYLLNWCNDLPRYFAMATPEIKKQIIMTITESIGFDGVKLNVKLHPVFEDLLNIDKNELEPTPKNDLDRTLEMCTVATKKAPEDAFSKNGADDGVRTHVYRYHKPRS